MGISLSTGAPLENLDGGSFTGDCGRRTKVGSGNRASLSLSLGGL